MAMIVVFEYGGGDEHPPVEKQVALGGRPVSVKSEQGLDDLVPVPAPRSLASARQVSPGAFWWLTVSVTAVPAPPDGGGRWRLLGGWGLSNLGSSWCCYCCRFRRRCLLHLLLGEVVACFAAV